MLWFLTRRAAVFLLSLLAASIVIFFVLSILPGDPATVILGTQATPEAVAELRAELGLDRPVVAQYLDWLGGVALADFGTSYITSREIAPQLLDRLQITVPLALLGMVFAVLVAFPAGVFAAARHRRLADTTVSTLSQVGLALPAFWAGLLLVSWFSVRLGWFPAGGFPGWDEDVGGSLKALVLPAVSLALVQGAILTRYVRSAVLEVLREDFIRTARAKGLTRTAALWRHGLRNAAIPVLTILGLQLGALLAGTIVIESVFVLPGLGSMVLQAIGRRDLLLVQAAALLIAGFILAINLIVDVTYRVVDPRVREA